jgi:hypothetical protein
VAESTRRTEPNLRRRRTWLWIGIGAVGLVIVLLAAFEILLSRAEPILRARLTKSLSARYHSRVEMGAFDVSLLRGFQVSGQDLAIYPYNINSSTPTFAVRHFSFRTGYRSLVRSPMRIGYVRVEGLRIQMPAQSQRRPAAAAEARQDQTQSATPTIFVDEMECVDTVLTLGTDKPGKVPAKFIIQSIDLRSIGAGKPMEFTATLTNPKPAGQIESRGFFGPWNADHPGATALGGSYSFSHADLGVFKGIGGILSSTGTYQGTLDRIVVDGETDTPDFQVKISGHPVALHTDFHAIVDGTDGNTYLQPVRARFLHTLIVARGYVVRAQGRAGRHTYLDVAIDQGTIEDLLRLAVRTDPPVMEGQVKLHTKLDLPPGPEGVVHRLKLQGTFAIVNGRFRNPKIQSQVNQISLRSQGEVELAQQRQREGNSPMVRSQMNGNFDLVQAALQLSNLRYQIPGATVRLAGVYSLDGARFHLAGTADMQATLSRMVGGWRGLLLMPFDRIFKKNGAGTEVPFTIDGTKSNPHFGLDFGRLSGHASPVKPSTPIGVGIGPKQ